MAKNQTVLILSDTHTSNELKTILSESSEDIKFELLPDDQVTRSPFMDPTVLAALIGAGATTLASLIALIGVIWSTRQNENKASDDAVIQIKINKAALEFIINRNPDQYKQIINLPEGETSNKDILELPIKIAANLKNSDTPYKDILQELLPAEVEHVAIIEDN